MTPRTNLKARMAAQATNSASGETPVFSHLLTRSAAGHWKAGWFVVKPGAKPEEGVRAMLRAGGRPGAIMATSVTAEQRPELDRVAELTIVMEAGERANAGLAQRQVESERQEQRRGLRM